MYKKYYIGLMILLLVLSGCSNNYTEPEHTIKKVALFYNESSPISIASKKDVTDNSKESMYLVTIKGHFSKNNMHASYIRFSMLADGSLVWNLRAYNGELKKVIWADDNIKLQ